MIRSFAIFAVIVTAFGNPLASAQDASSPARATDPGFFLQGEERVVWFGDSITQAGDYITQVEATLRARYPQVRTWNLINHGISSETVSGTSEPDHNPRRPDAHNRFDRDVAAWNPDVVVACFGMNDGNYHPFDPAIFARYQQGVQRLISRVRAIRPEPIRLVLLTPPPFDPYSRGVGDRKAVHYGYRFPAVDYDQVLGRFSEWLLTQADPKTRLDVIDLHGVINAHVKKRREKEVSFTLAPDAVHPDATGHWLMARTILNAWRLPRREILIRFPYPETDGRIETILTPKTADAKSDKTGNRLDPFVVRIQAGENPQPFGGLSAEFVVPVTEPVAPQVDPTCFALLPPLERHSLKIANLPEGRYLVKITGDAAVLEHYATHQELANGLILDAMPKYPPRVQAQALRQAIQTRRQRTDAAWRASKSGPQPVAPDPQELTLAQPVRLRVNVLRQSP